MPFQNAQPQFPWLIRLRWAAIIGQVLTMSGAYLIAGLDLSLGHLSIVAMLTGLVNLVAFGVYRVRATLSTGWTASFLALDIGLFTAWLALSGGVHNPFSVFYIVYVMFAVLLLPGPLMWGLGALAIGCFAVLLRYYVPLSGLSHEMHLYGMWVAFAIVAGVSAYFVRYISAALRAQEARLARTERLTSLVALVAGATHELATPLATIAVVAKELERAMVSQAAPADWVQDVQLLHTQVRRCRELLRHMSIKAGQVPGENWVEVPIGTLFARVLAQVSAADQARITVEGLSTQAVAMLPVRAFEHAVLNLLRNALEASTAAAPIVLRYECHRQQHRIVIADRGMGISRALLEQLGEPFVTTKASGHGLGLGVFTTKMLLEHLGGTLQVDSEEGKGTTVSMEWPQ